MTVTAPPSVPPAGPSPHDAPPPSARPAGTVDAALAVETPFTRWLVRWRAWFFVGLALLIVLNFNGKWRVGLDSAIYRGVADNLAAGHGYTFAGRKQTQVYPGLPAMLAALQRGLHTNSLVPPLVALNAMALLTLAGVYQLIKLRYPLWVAVAVTCGVGMNARFVQQAQEVMTDTPFLCAVVAALLGWEWLGGVRGRGKAAGALTLLAGGLFVAATMRPTFWVLAVAWGLVAAWNSVVRRERRSMVALATLVVVGLAFVALDPRVHGMSLLQGAYEKELFQNFAGIGGKLAKNAPGLFLIEFPEAFFNELMSVHLGKMPFSIPASLPFTLLILGGCAMLLRRQPLWALQVFILTGIMLLLSDVPRYYLMVLPTLWLGYTVAIVGLTRRWGPRARDVALFLLFSLANVQNLGGVFHLIFEQHAKNFAVVYKKGSYEPLRQMAAVLRDKLKPGDVIVGPNAQILAYMSGRDVVNGRLLSFETTPPSKYPKKVADANPTYVVGPLDAYEKKDVEIYRLLAAGVIVPKLFVAQTPDKSLWLATATVTVPTAADWRKLPTTRRLRPVSPNRPTHRNESPEAAKNRLVKIQRLHKRVKAERTARAEHRAHQERKARKQHRQPATAASAAGGGTAGGAGFDASLPPFATPGGSPSMAADGRAAAAAGAGR